MSMAQTFKDCQDEKQVQNEESKLFVKRRPMSVLTYFLVSSIRLWDESIFYYHQVDPSKFQLEHGKFSFYSRLFHLNVISESVPPPFNL